MKFHKHFRVYLLVCSLVVALQPLNGFAQSNSDAAKTNQTLKQRDGQTDFDFEIGTWKTHLKRLLHPLTGSTTWVEYDGMTVVQKVWNGRANLVELNVDGPAGHIEALSLRLYNPESHQWSLNFANSAGGTMSQPTIGEFKNGRGEFFDQETLNGRAIFVRFVISDITPTSCRFEQAFSNDGGKTWEINWIAVDTRSGDPKLDRAIEKANSEFIAAMKTGDAAPIAAPYTDDAVFIAFDGTCTQGRTEIEKMYRARFERSGLASSTKVNSERLVVDGELAYESGYAEIRSLKQGKLEINGGRFLTVWQRQAAGEWKILRNVVLP